MSDFLVKMRDSSRERMLRARSKISISTVVRTAQTVPKVQRLKPAVEGFDLIAEIKKSSPSAGELSSESNADLITRAIAYAEAGAIAVSVLTEPDYFGGDLEQLKEISCALVPYGVPTMRKDFLVDVYQVWEAAAAGAGGVLLIVRMLDDETIMEMLEAAARARIFVLLEAFDETDLRRAAPFVSVHQRVMVGLNTRNLATLEVDPDRLTTLIDRFPYNCQRVAESGINNPSDAAAAARAGYQIALVGTALMKSDDPKQLIREMLLAGREATQW